MASNDILIKVRFHLITLNAIFQGRKDQVWLIFTYISILIRGIEVLPKCIAPFNFSDVILVLFSNCKGVYSFESLFSWPERPKLDICYLIRPIYQTRCML